MIIDFGLAKKYITPEGTHKSVKTTQKFKGTLMYASVNAHNFTAQSRRDDMMSYFYMLLEMLGETLPWRTDSKSDFQKTRLLKAEFSKNIHAYLKQAVSRSPEMLKIH